MANADHRQLHEMMNIFSNPKNARQAWKAIGNAIAARPASKPIVVYDKEGNLTYNSEVEAYSYKQLYNDINSLSDDDREPTQLEMILMCQMVKARTDTAAATFIRDTLGAKPVDESKVDVSTNPYENLTDEELQLIADHRAAQLAASELSEPSSPSSTIVEGEQLSLFDKDGADEHT